MTTWSLASEVRNRLLVWWQSACLAFMLLLLVQTIVGKYEQIESQVWQWAAISLLPGLVLLYLGTLLHHSPAKLIPPAVRNAIYSVNIGYLVIVLITLLLQKRGLDMQQQYEGLDVYFERSYVWLLPLNGLVTFTLVTLMLVRKSLFLPDNKAISALAQRKLAQINNDASFLRKPCFELIAGGNLEGAFNLLSDHFNSNPSSQNAQDFLVLSNEFYSIRREATLNTIDPAYAQRQLNRIAVALLNTADAI